MKRITQKDIDDVRQELLDKRKEFESIEFKSLEEKLEWIQTFFNSYVPMLEERYMSQSERKKWIVRRWNF